MSDGRERPAAGDALLIIDMQRWMFRTPERSAQLPVLCANIASLIAVFETSGLPIFDVRTEHRADRSTWSRLMRKHDYSCLIEGTPDAEPVEGFSPPRGGIGVIKRANSAFLGTALESRLKDAAVDRLFLCGVFMDGCVGLTAADAAQRGYDVVFVTDAIGHTGDADHAAIRRWLVADYELGVATTAGVAAAADPEKS
jgi:nicotinamidase-related amidase